MNNIQIARTLRKLRGERTQKEMADEIGISVSSYCQAEKHGFMPEYGMVKAMILKFLEEHDIAPSR